MVLLVINAPITGTNGLRKAGEIGYGYMGIMAQLNGTNTYSGGTEVTAVPDAGYTFADWSDGRTDNPRTDAHVTNHLTVTANFAPLPPPAIVRTSPTNSAVYLSPATIALAATVTTNGNTIHEVQFFSHETNLLRTAMTAPYVVVWTNVSAGSHDITAAALYNGTNLVRSATAAIAVLAPVPPVFSGPLAFEGGAFPFSFSATNGQSYRILYTTNLSLPQTNWSELIRGVFGPGANSYTDTAATNAARFHRIVSP